MNKTSPRRSAAGRGSFAAAIVGCGNIGSFACQLLVRAPAIARLVLIDQDSSYTPANLEGQNVCVRDTRKGRAKVIVMRRALAQIRPGLEVIACHSPVALVPRGRLAVDLILACLDSKRARQDVAEAAWRLGVPLIDAGVHADGHLVRVSIFVPGASQPCLECAWDDGDYAALEQRFACGVAPTPAPRTNAPACLGSLAASLQVSQALLLLPQLQNPPGAGRQVVLDVASRRLYDVRLPRNPACRFDHETWQIRRLRHKPNEMSLGEAFRLGNPGRAATSALSQEPGFFVRTLACRSGHRRATLIASTAIERRAPTCQKCSKPMFASNLGATSCLHFADLAPADLARPLSAIGFRPGDVFTLRSDEHPSHYQLALE